MRILIITFIIIVILLAIWIIGSYFSVRNLEEPDYNVISQKTGYEIRQYNSYIVAEVEVEWNQNEALNNWFRYLAGYIFWGNTNKDSIKMTAPVSETQTYEKISMTVPVMETESTSISMTAPVMDTPNTQWSRIVQFTMPRKYTLETLPIPDNDKVTLREIPAKKVAVLRYSGYASEKRVTAKKEKLLELLERDNMKLLSNITSAQYNPPLSFPLTRRNEVMIEVE